MEQTLKNLSFPLNVYALLMHRAAGEVPYLSYAMLSQQSAQLSDYGQLAEHWLASQHEFAERLIKLIRHPAPASVLDAGCGFATLAVKLAKAEFKVTALDNNAAAVECAQRVISRAGQLAVELNLADFAGFSRQCPPAAFDVLIFQNSARYFKPLDLFAAARRLLRPGGQLLVFDEFSTRVTSRHEPQLLPVIDHVLALADRSGFDLDHDEDLSTGVGRFLGTWLHCLENNQDDLAKVFDDTEPTVRMLIDAVADDLCRCLDGRVSHRLLSWQLNGDRSDTILVNAGELPAGHFCEVFESSFKTHFDPQLWDWKYGNGLGASVAAVRNGRVVAHYGGAVRDIWYFGQRDTAVQICDVMVVPGERSFFSRQGHFFKTAASMLEQYAGYASPHLLGFGFPNLKAMHIAQRLKLYEKTDELVQLRLPASASAAEASLIGEQEWSITSAASSLPADTEIDQLWDTMRAGFSGSVIGVRDARYLRYRFCSRPGLTYQCVSLRHHGELLALGFLREHGEHWLLMDIVTAHTRLADVLRSLHDFCQSSGKALLFWLTAGQVARFEAANPIVDVLGIEIPCNRWSDGPATDTLTGAWWLTAGDMDFM